MTRAETLPILAAAMELFNVGAVPGEAPGVVTTGDKAAIVEPAVWLCLRAMLIGADGASPAGLRRLVARLADALTDEGAAWSIDGLAELRHTVADALPLADLPDWLHPYRHAA